MNNDTAIWWVLLKYYQEYVIRRNSSYDVNKKNNENKITNNKRIKTQWRKITNIKILVIRGDFYFLFYFFYIFQVFYINYYVFCNKKLS